jgi:hypothetical protein
VDSSGQAILAGVTYSQDFPLSNAFQSSVVAGENGNWGCYGYVTKFSADGASLVYSTYLAGSTLPDNSPNYSYNGPFSQIDALSVDLDGNAYAVGNTNTTDFPVTQAAFMPNFPGSSATSVGFLSKLSSSGVLGYSTYLGGTDHNYLSAVTVDANGSAYVAGWDSGNDNFPVTSTGICDPSSQSCSGGTVTKFDSSGSNILYSTYLAGNNDVAADGIQVDASGNAFILSNSSNDQYGLTNPIQNYAGGGDAIIIELDPSGNSELFASFVGGSQFEMGSSIALDTHGAVYIVGTTLSADFPTTQSAFQNTLGGQEDAFVVKIGISQAIPTAIANISPAGLTFPATALGVSSGSQSFTITNTGTAVLNVTGIQVSGDFAVQDSNCGSVAANETCTVSVTFTPTTSGAHSGDITIVDTATDSPQIVTLSGAGLDFTLSAVNADATVISGGTASYVLHLTAVGGSFSSPVTFACSGAPQFASCTINPSVVTLSGTTSDVSVTVTTSNSSLISSSSGQAFSPMIWLPQSLGLLCVFLGGKVRRRHIWTVLTLGVILGTILLATGCGGSSPASQKAGQSQLKPSGTYELVVTGSSGSIQRTVSLTLTVQ